MDRVPNYEGAMIVATTIGSTLLICFIAVAIVLSRWGK